MGAGRLRYLHHPLHAPASQVLVEPSLELLQEIQQTGDIFFPKGWLDVTLGGYNSPEVAATVREFLRSRPDDYPLRLKMLTLQSADELFSRRRDGAPVSIPASRKVA